MRSTAGAGSTRPSASPAPRARWRCSPTRRECGPKFFLSALEFATERAYGKATVDVEQTINNPPPPINPDELRAIYAFVLGRRMSVPQAENYIRTHPEELKARLAKHSKS